MVREKKEIFSKFKDYNNELEKVLETKYFSETTKNLLLSMLYKIEVAHKDYTKVKVENRTKKEFVEEIIGSIKENCEEIEIVNPREEKAKILEENKVSYMVFKEKKKIISYANEREILKAIIEISNKESDPGEKYLFMQKPLQLLFDLGKILNNVEIIRDFDGWSWNIEKTQIKNFEYNLLYQNLRLLLRSTQINQILQEKDYFYKIVSKLKEVEKENSKIKIENILVQMILGLYLRTCVNHRKELEEQRIKFEEEVNEMKDKISLVEKISKQKKNCVKKIKQMDEIMNNRSLLIEEYRNRNLKAKPEEKIFSVSDLAEILEKERENLLCKIKELNKNIKPEKYVKQKEILEYAEKNLQEALEKPEEEWIETKIEFQKKFLKILTLQLQKIETKKEILEFIYVFRYYLLIPVNEESSIKDRKEIQKEIDNIVYIIVKKACAMKVMNTIHEDVKINSEILKSVFLVKVIDLEDIEIELKKENETVQVKICEQEAIDNVREIEIEPEENYKLKYNKKMKVFI